MNSAAWRPHPRRRSRPLQLRAKAPPGRVDAVSCWSAGNCTASGYEISSTFDGMFAVSEQAGQWGHPVHIPLSPRLTAIHADGNTIYAMSCASAGNCAVLQRPEPGGDWSPRA
jgi:hypothetical protein